MATPIVKQNGKQRGVTHRADRRRGIEEPRQRLLPRFPWSCGLSQPHAPVHKEIDSRGTTKSTP